MLSRTVERASREEYTPAASVKKYRLDADRPGERPFVSDIYCIDPLALSLQPAELSNSIIACVPVSIVAAILTHRFLLHENGISLPSIYTSLASVVPALPSGLPSGLTGRNL